MKLRKDSFRWMTGMHTKSETSILFYRILYLIGNNKEFDEDESASLINDCTEAYRIYYR